MPENIRISAQTARRLVLGKQGLWPGRRWTGKDGAREAMRAMEYVQLDPLAILARSHDLMLHSRVAGYEPEHFHALTYEDREFFEWGGWLAVRSMDELPYWRVIMRRERDHGGVRQIGEQHAVAIEQMRATLRERGTVASADFAATGEPTIDHYRGGKATSLALYYLWRTGEAMTHHRERFQRVYAPAEAVAPAHLLVEAPEGEAEAFIARKAVAFGGVGRAARLGMPLSRLLARPMPGSEQLAIEQQLVDSGQLAPVEVEGMKGIQFVLAEDVPVLETIARGGVPDAWRSTSSVPEVSFLSPLDPVSARGRAKALFGFDYIWEIYLPAEKMRYGRYTLPILYGDSLVGRIDMKLDRATNTLIVNGLWFEDEATGRDETFQAAFAMEFARLVVFLGTERVDNTRLARSLRRLLKPAR